MAQERGQQGLIPASLVENLERIRILLADDHKPLLDTVSNMLSQEFDVVGAVNDGQKLIDECEHLQPDLLVVDISMPSVNGIEAVSQLKINNSQLNVVFLTVHENPEYVRECFAAGALGYVVKSRIVTDLIEAVKAVHAGNRYVSPSITF